MSSRDGPNVRQSFDAVWADWETPDWRFIGFASRPVQYRDDHAFDDRSNTDFRFDSVRVERHVFGDKELSAYGRCSSAPTRVTATARARSDARCSTPASPEPPTTSTGTSRPWAREAWSARRRSARGRSARAGVTDPTLPWHPRAGPQVDAASGDANLLHVKPSLTVRPAPDLSLMVAAAALWRQTTADSIYVQPNVAIPGTAAHGSRCTGAYGQLRADYAPRTKAATRHSWPTSPTSSRRPDSRHDLTQPRGKQDWQLDAHGIWYPSPEAATSTRMYVASARAIDVGHVA